MKTIIVYNSSADKQNVRIKEADLALSHVSRETIFRAVKEFLETKIFDLAVSRILLDDREALVIFVKTNTKNQSGGFQEMPLSALKPPVQDEIRKYWLYIKAIEFARASHGSQTYSSRKLPYYYHLKQTDKVIDHFFHELPANKTLTLKMAALLHDVLEDTPATLEDLKREFGEDVADIVYTVTKINEESAPGYEESYYAKIAQNPLAIYIKIADKCANSKQTVKCFSTWHARRIIDGHTLFRKYIYGKIQGRDLKQYLDDLVLRLKNHYEQRL